MATQSPFLGMDPYLEHHWRDVHHSLVAYAREQLQGQLPRDLRARVEERDYLTNEEGPGRSLYPDVRVKESPRAGGGGTALATAVAEGVLVDLEAEEATEGFLEIREVGTDARVITVIEFLSETNKIPVKGRQAYEQKQKELADAQVSLVEIDLLRAGYHVVVAPLERIPPSARTIYLACVRRAWKRAQCRVYPISLREPLPTIAIPLRQTDADVKLDLRALLAKVYDVGGFDDIDYRKNPEPPLDPADAAWADQLLHAKGLR